MATRLRTCRRGAAPGLWCRWAGPAARRCGRAPTPRPSGWRWVCWGTCSRTISASWPPTAAWRSSAGAWASGSWARRGRCWSAPAAAGSTAGACGSPSWASCPRATGWRTCCWRCGKTRPDSRPWRTATSRGRCDGCAADCRPARGGPWTRRGAWRAPGASRRLDREALQRRTLRVLIGAQILGGAGFLLGFAVPVLLAREPTDAEALVGLPVAIAVAAAALAARPMGTWMQRSGRRPGLAAGQIGGAAGALVILLAARVESFPLFCAGMGLFGVGNASNLLARYAASDLSDPSRRGQAISALLFATAAGAMLGPNLAEAAGGLGGGLGG